MKYRVGKEINEKWILISYIVGYYDMKNLMELFEISLTFVDNKKIAASRLE